MLVVGGRGATGDVSTGFPLQMTLNVPGTSDDDDRMLLDGLRKQAHDLVLPPAPNFTTKNRSYFMQVQGNFLSFRENMPFEELVAAEQRALVFLHTMRNEHFGPGPPPTPNINAHPPHIHTHSPPPPPPPTPPPHTPSGISLVEAMAAGAVVVAHNSGGPRDDIKPPCLCEDAEGCVGGGGGGMERVRLNCSGGGGGERIAGVGCM